MTKRTQQGPPRSRRLLLAHEDVQAARRLLSLLASDEPEQPGSRISRRELAQRAQAELDLRHRRFERLGDRFAAEPAFAILLALYIAEDKKSKLSVSRTVELSLLSNATAVRWIDLFVEEKWVCRRSDPEDARKVLLELTSTAREAIDDLFAEV